MNTENYSLNNLRQVIVKLIDFILIRWFFMRKPWTRRRRSQHSCQHWVTNPGCPSSRSIRGITRKRRRQCFSSIVGSYARAPAQSLVCRPFLVSSLSGLLAKKTPRSSMLVLKQRWDLFSFWIRRPGVEKLHLFPIRSMYNCTQNSYLSTYLMPKALVTQVG
jgi:hypothetical protein